VPSAGSQTYWTVHPRFEKMLYDNAQLARVYLHAWQLTGHAFFGTIAQETLDYVAREMRDPEGGFYATQDADSEGEEGKFFVWTAGEIRRVLGDEAETFMAAYGVKPGGNWEGKNILELVGTLEEREALVEARRKLFQVRETRVRPGRDEKVLTSWNGLMLAAFALVGDAASRLLSARYRRIAEENAESLLHHLQTDRGRLFHTWKHRPRRVLEEPGEGATGEGGNTGIQGTAKVDGFLEDYAHLAEGQQALYGATFHPRWYQAAHNVVDAAIARFWVSEEGFCDTAADSESLIARPRDLQDNATPSGNAMMATVLPKLSGLAMAPRYAELTRQNLAAVQDHLARTPLGFGQWLVALDYALSRRAKITCEIAIVGPPDDQTTRQLPGVATAGFRPHRVVAYGPAGQEAPAVPLLQDRALIEGRPAAYVSAGISPARDR
jgi:uncharacterized protein YyaL (SSP411 family)